MEIKELFGEEWYKLLKGYLESQEFNKLGTFLNERRKAFNVEVYPEKENIFRAFRECPLEKTKIVLIGMDPYPTKGNAIGLAFGYNGNGSIPKSLQNIYKEYENDVMNGLDLMFDYSLTKWAQQGVLLINTALTVERGNPGSHTKQWKNFTNYLFTELGKHNKDIIYICWGNHAKSFIPLFKEGNKIIESVHPSPLSARKGFFGSKPFSKANKYLKELGKEEINW